MAVEKNRPRRFAPSFDNVACRGSGNDSAYSSLAVTLTLTVVVTVAVLLP